MRDLDFYLVTTIPLGLMLGVFTWSVIHEYRKDKK